MSGLGGNILTIPFPSAHDTAARLSLTTVAFSSLLARLTTKPVEPGAVVSYRIGRSMSALRVLRLILPWPFEGPSPGIEQTVQPDPLGLTHGNH